MSMTAVLTNTQKQHDSFKVEGTVTLSGNYVAAGDTLDLSKLGVPSNSLPRFVRAWSTVTAAVIDDTYAYIPGTTQANGKLQIKTGGADMGAAAYNATAPTNTAGYVLHFEAEFPAFV